MKRKKLFSYLLLLLLFLTIELIHPKSLHLESEQVLIPFKFNTLTNHVSIIIEYDENFTDYGFPGLGIESDPYRIDGYNITVNNLTGVYIFNVTKYFTITNCFVNAIDTGIYIDEVAENRASIFNTTCIDNDNCGIRIENSSNSTVVNVICNDNYNGIRFRYASGLTLKNATVLNCRYGISLYQSSSSKVLDCISSYTTHNEGISLSYSNSSTLKNNIFNFNENAGIHLTHTGDCKIINNTCNYNDNHGIYLHRSDNLFVVNNTANNNEYDGIHFALYSKSTVINNTCIDNKEVGFMLYGCNDFSIYRNLIQNSGGYGLFVGGSRNTIHHNAFVDNNMGGISQAYEVHFETDNLWYDIATNEGNYWNDWSGSGEYKIDGEEYRSDPYPLSAVPPGFPKISEYNSNATHIMLLVCLCIVFIVRDKKKRRLKL